MRRRFLSIGNLIDNPSAERRSGVRLAARSRAGRVAPYAVAVVLLLLGYRHYAPGAAYSLSAEAYRTFAFPEFQYSDVIWLYLRDGLERHPVPYVDFPLEYPPLTGVLTYLLSFAPTLPAFYGAAYALLAACALATIAVVRRLPGANAWWYAAAPALLFYTGHQWDGVAICMTALAVLAVGRGHDRWGAFGLTVAVWLKLFPFAFLAALLIARARQRRWREVVAIGAIFALGTILVNLPFALANRDGWLFFYRWNRDRLADAGIWVLWRDLPTTQITTLSMSAAIAGGLLLAGFALWPRGPIRMNRNEVTLPLGAILLLWWLVVNKTFTTHLVLWVFFAFAILRVPWWLWAGMVVVDVAAFQLGNFLNLPNVPDFDYDPLILKAIFYLYDPLQVMRFALLLIAVGWGVVRLTRRDVANQVAQIVAGLVGPGSVTDAAISSGQTSPAAAGLESVSVSPIDATRPAGANPSAQILPREDDSVLLSTKPDQGECENGAIGNSSRHRLAVGSLGSLASSGLITAVYVAATIVMTWPYALHLSHATVVGFDPLLQIWLSQWVQHALATNPLGLYDANIFYPFAQTLAYTDANVPGALLAAPLDWLTGDAILTNSLLVLSTFVLAAGGMCALMRHLTGNLAAGFLAGLAYAFVPFRIVNLWHLNWLESAWWPWLLLATLLLLERPTRGRAVLLGALIGVQTLTSFYFAVQIGLVVGLMVIATSVAQRRVPSRQLLVALLWTVGLAALMIVPLYLPYVNVRTEQRLERTLIEAEHYKATGESFVTLPPWDQPNPLQRAFGVRAGINDSLLTVGQAPHADGHTHPEIVIEDALFPGSFVLLGAALAVFGLLFRWRGSVTAIGSPSLGTAPRSVPPLLAPIALALAITACIAALLSLGPSWGARDGSGQPLPYGFLFEHAPFFKAMRVPARLGGLVDVALVALAGIGAAVVWRWLRTRPLVARRRHLVGLGIVALLSLGILADLDAAPIPLESVDRGAEVAAVYEWLARQPDDGAVMEFPAESIFADPAGTSVRRHVGLSMYWSTYHWKPLVNGNSGFIPRAYSDMIEAFVGQLPRSDGTLTGRISHVDRQNVALLQQFGVRYLIFHRSQYHAEDWSAVIAALDAAETELERVGDFGEATVYRVYPPLMPPPAARVTMFAPTLLTPESPWAPLFVVSKPGSFPSLLALTRPSILTLTWYDARGRQLWRGEQRVPLPVVVYDEQLLCTLERCESAPDVEFPVALPAPTPTDEVWRPVEPGHYVARLTMSGDQSLACKVDLDLVEDSERVADLSPDSPYRWAECVVGEAHPVNDPGAVPFWSPLPSVAFIEGKIALEATLTTRTDEEIRAWFFLAPPGVATPWRQPAFQSEIRQRLVKAGEPAEFDWLEDVSGTVAPGVYGLTIWFHQRHGDGWSHAYGGAFQLSPVIVDPDGSVRWAGPVRLVRAGRLPRFRPGDTARLRLIVTGTSATTGCKLAWRVVRPSDSSVVAEGNAGSCEAPRIRLPARLPPDRYRLEMIASATRDERSRLSDGLTFEITVVEAEQRGMPR